MRRLLGGLGRKTWLTGLAGLGSLAVAARLARRRDEMAREREQPAAEGNWSPVRRDEPSLGDARSML
jgi:hypothetical protein